jgi:hypothetical protein
MESVLTGTCDFVKSRCLELTRVRALVYKDTIPPGDAKKKSGTVSNIAAHSDRRACLIRVNRTLGLRLERRP